MEIIKEKANCETKQRKSMSINNVDQKHGNTKEWATERQLVQKEVACMVNQLVMLPLAGQANVPPVCRDEIQYIQQILPSSAEKC